MIEVGRNKLLLNIQAGWQLGQFTRYLGHIAVHALTERITSQGYRSLKFAACLSGISNIRFRSLVGKDPGAFTILV